MDDSSKGVIAVGVGEAKIYLMDQLSTTVSRLKRRTSVFSHNPSREPRKGIDVERVSRETKSLNAYFNIA